MTNGITLLTPVDKIEDGHNYTTVTTRSAASFKARKVVCTISLNVLKDLEFSPNLASLTQQAISNGWTQKRNKVHFEITGPELASWTSFASPGKGLICALGEKILGPGAYSW
ncbi:hypothetical protein LTS07_007317 [Exophiala sideris]|uniref:Amine oxidase domain-containing protein n=1 Tax=Exophiala sideris TaxID=1016849 RepID=A0ABR0J4C8_9EURO|nr:hypothetical protein LTS07_007317 [Exophiala sideris]KAK5034022.1 hypothetical protein LTR13_006622 [Exophiala sideris]KAK5055703.1 hypothetical protein LTR69_008078 [Exophiala sideris]KAK5180964.1 hypothetical protein LTR44_006784 [Eurotiomycetes sp. CCFEE 6388]